MSTCKVIDTAPKSIVRFGDDALLVYDGTIEGFYSCVFACFDNKSTPLDIVPEGRQQLSLFGGNVRVRTNQERAMRVHDGLARKLGSDEASRVQLGFLSDDPEREMKLLRYIQIAMRKGRYSFCDHSNLVVRDYEKLWRQVSNERHHMLQFARFAELDGGVFFAKINPNANVVPVMMEHFAKRYNTERFVIYDEVHNVAGVYAQNDWTLVKTSSLDIPDTTDDEERYRRMWKSFYDSICNRERLNPKVRTSWMPKRLWSNICEVADEIPGQRRDRSTLEARGVGVEDSSSD